MYTFHILGPLELNRSDGAPIHSVLAQPKRVALLAYLALAPFGTRSREEILSLLWSEPERDRARHAMRQAIYYLRRSLGAGVLHTEGETVALDRTLVRTDAHLFLSALEAGRLDEAAGLYRGELLHGFTLTDDPGFDRWVDGAREMLRRKALNAVEALSRKAEEGADLAGAVVWAERAVDLAPYEEAPMRRLLALLVAGGDRVRARTTFDRFVARVREELEMEPSPEMGAILATPVRVHPAGLSAGSAATASHRPPPDGPPVAPPFECAPGGSTSVGSAPGEPAPGEPVAGSSSTESAPVRSPPFEASPAGPAVSGSPPEQANARARTVAATPVTTRSRRARYGGVLYALLGAALVVAVIPSALPDLEGGRGPAPVGGEGSRIGIFPFTYLGRSELAYLADGIPELMTISVGGLDGVSAVDLRALAASLPEERRERWTAEDAEAAARQYGAEYFVVGSVLEVGGQIQVTAQLHCTDNQLVNTIAERIPNEDGLFELVDDLVRRLVASEAFPTSSSLARSAAATTTSLPALRHFLRGERLFRSGQFKDAVQAFDAAVLEDSTFALAFYRGAISSIWSDEAEFDAAREKVSRALVHRDRVSDLEGTLLEALNEFLMGRLAEADILYGTVLQRQPENVEAWFQLGEARFHHGALHGRDISESREAWQRVLEIAPDDRAALIHLSAVAASQGSAALDSLEERLSSLGDTFTPAPQVQGMRVFSTGSQVERAAFLEEMTHQPLGTVRSTAAYVARYVGDPEAASRIARVLTVPSRPPADRAEGFLLLAHLDLSRGRIEAARQFLEEAVRLDPAAAESHRLLLATVPRIPVGRRTGAGTGGPPNFDAGLRIRVEPSSNAAVPADDSVAPALLLYGRALLYHQAGGEDGALLTAARELTKGSDAALDESFVNALGAALQAERDLARGDDAAAREELGAVAMVERWYERLRHSWDRSLARERFLLAELDIRNGRDATAEGLLRSLTQNSVAEMVYLGPALIRLGEIRERVGDRAGARYYYGRALDLWSEADPALAPLTSEIAARFKALEGVRV